MPTVRLTALRRNMGFDDNGSQVLVRAVNDIPLVGNSTTLLPSIFLCHPRKFSDTFFFFLTCPPFLWIVFTSLGLSIRQSLHPLHVAVSVVSSSLVSFRQKNPRFFLLRKATIVFLFLNIFFSWISVERMEWFWCMVEDALRSTPES